jgi:hypothetical protein
MVSEAVGSKLVQADGTVVERTISCCGQVQRLIRYEFYAIIKFVKHT